MKKILDHVHDPVERALYTSVALGIQMYIEYESYGSTESVRAMKEDIVLIHSKIEDVKAYLIGLYNKVNAVLSVISASGLHHQDKDRCIESLKETCAPKKAVEIYLEWIYENKSLIRELR